MTIQLACFGFITCFDGDSDSCKACDKAKQCQKTCYDELLTLDSGLPSVRTLTKKHERWARLHNNQVKSTTRVRENFQTYSNDKVAGMSKIGEQVARSLLHNYIDLKPETCADVQDIQPSYLKVMIERLRSDSLVTRELIDQLKREMRWTENTAKRYAAGFIEVAVRWGAVKQQKRGVYKQI